MTSLFAILIGVVIVNHLVLVRFPAICPLPDGARRLDLPPVAWLVTALVLTSAVAAAWATDARLLRAFDLRELRLLALVFAIIVAAPAGTLLIGLVIPKRRDLLAQYRPLVTADCVMLGVALLVAREPATLPAAIAWAGAMAILFCAVLALFAELGERLEDADVPTPLRGSAIALVTGGMMSLALTGIASMVRG